MVEMALVVSVCLMFLFGIFEYGRYLMTLQTLTNAAREGARWASVNTDDPNANPTLDVQQYTLSKMAGLDQQLQGSGGGSWVYTNEIQVFKADPNTGNPLDANNNVVIWTSASYTNAGFEQAIAVKITGQFIPNLPSFLLMGNAIPIQAQAIMYSEAN
jgi:Flp pilus assembly protein TadG